MTILSLEWSRQDAIVVEDYFWVQKKQEEI